MIHQYTTGIIVAFILLLTAPMAQSQTTADLIWGPGEEGELTVWRVDEEPRADNTASIAGNSSWIRFTPYESAVPQSIMFIDVWITPSFRSTSDGSWNYSFEATANGVEEWSNCWAPVATVAAGGVLAGDLVTTPSIPLRCAVVVELADDEPFSWWINRTVLSGNPDAPEETSVSIIINRGEFIVTSSPTNFETLSGLTAFEFTFVLLLVALGIMFWSRSLDPLVRFIGGLLPMVAAFLILFTGFEAGWGTIWPGMFAIFVMFALTSLYLLIRWGIQLIEDALT